MTSHAALKIKIQLYCGDEIAMGPGKADLLDAIAATGSISAAARHLGMSYRRAWLLVDVMNRCWRAPLVATAPGGFRHGGARLTPSGEEVLAFYRALTTRADACVDAAEWRALCEAVLPAPRLSQKGG